MFTSHSYLPQPLPQTTQPALCGGYYCSWFPKLYLNLGVPSPGLLLPSHPHSCLSYTLPCLQSPLGCVHCLSCHVILPKEDPDPVAACSKPVRASSQPLQRKTGPRLAPQALHDSAFHHLARTHSLQLHASAVLILPSSSQTTSLNTAPPSAQSILSSPLSWSTLLPVTGYLMLGNR